MSANVATELPGVTIGQGSAPFESAQNAVTYLGKSATSFDSRFTLRVLRSLPVLRRQIDANALASLIAQSFDAAYATELLGLLKLEYQGDFGSSVPVSPEVDAFVHLLAQVWAFHESHLPPSALVRFGERALEHVSVSYNRRSLDHFIAKMWFYSVHAAEQANELHSPKLYAEMMAAMRTATLRHDFETQAMLITLLLRTLLATNRVGMAANLVAKTTFPESSASNSLAARYYYYLSRVNAIELDYGTAFEQITAAIRKVPQTAAAKGFLQTANKLSVLIELLMGDVPARKAFGSKEQPELVGPLAPYLALAKAVRAGDVNRFQQALAENEEALKRDRNLTLARRLRQNVIKTGIRVISLTYSRISLKDVCVKLGLDSEESAEYIVGKAIRDGVIDAKINHQLAYMESIELNNEYSTAEPQHAFNERIRFSMALRDDNVKALRYLGSDHHEDLKDAQEAREREKELVTEIQEHSGLEDEDDF